MFRGGWVERAGLLLLTSTAHSFPYPPLGLVERALRTTARSEFDGHVQTFEAAATWSGDVLRRGSGAPHSSRGPYLACAGYDNGGSEVFARLQGFLSPEAVRPVVVSSEHGTCFVATASHSQAVAFVASEDHLGLTSFAPFPSALKLAPSLLEHGAGGAAHDRPTDRLDAIHGAPMRRGTAEGLTVELSPGTLPANSVEDTSFVNDLLGDLISHSMDLHAINFWSDPASERTHDDAELGAAMRIRNWRRAATVVHELSESGRTSPGDICSWDTVAARHAGDDLLLVSGLDHLLPLGRGAGGSDEEEAKELKMACFMGLASFLASRPEVLRVAPRYAQRLLNASARAIINSATATDTPLTDAGLDGTGQVIQVVDTGVDETSCFFAHDEQGDQVPHGYLFDELGFALTSSSADPYSSSASSSVFTGGDFTVYPERRKIIQYIQLVKSDDEVQSHGDSFTTSGGEQFPWLPADNFEYDFEAGHGTHNAGSAAGATLNAPATTVTCEVNKTLSCAGGCIDSSALVTDDDLVSQSAQSADIDRLCPAFGCDDTENPACLTDDVSETLTNNGGMAQGAKLAIFDVFLGETNLAPLAGNGQWEVCSEADCNLHSNSWGSDTGCETDSLDIMYDAFMHENPENLLIFAAGNLGETAGSSCTIYSPAIAKNVLAVGATSSGETRLTSDVSDIDAVASFSSYGPTSDGRIKPELVAPGDMVYSAASDGLEESFSCRLWAYAGTSSSCSVVAGASAMVRQYFEDSSFYAADMTMRGLCGEWLGCEAFSPSSATIKALLINSANLLGGSSEPDGFRGFGRIHLEAGMPINGLGSLVLFVADAANTSIPALTRQEYNFEVDADAGLDFRATLSWIDPPATSISAIQLLHDLDLSVISPSGEKYTMWTSGGNDTANVNERVIVDAGDIASGVWSVWVWAKELTSTVQTYSLVVSGAIIPATGEGAVERSFSSSTSSDSGPTASPETKEDPQAPDVGMIAGVAVAICVVVAVVAVLAFRRSGRGCSKDRLAAAEAGEHANVGPPYSAAVLRAEHGGNKPIPTRSATRDRETHGGDDVSIEPALPTTASTGDCSTEERAEFAQVFRNGVTVEGGATSVSDINRPDAGKRGLSSKDRGQSIGGVGVACTVIDPIEPITNVSAHASHEPLPPPPPYELPPPPYEHLAMLSETDHGRRECLPTTGGRPGTTLESRGADSSGYSEPAIPARPSTGDTSTAPRTGLYEAFDGNYAKDGSFALSSKPGAGKSVDEGPADGRRRSGGGGVGVARAVMEAARDLAKCSPILGVSEAATLVSILIDLVSDSKYSDRESEARIKRCRSIVIMLQRAGKVLGKGGDTSGEAERLLIEDVHDAIFDLVELIKTYQSRNALSKVLLSTLFKRRQEEADAVIDRAMSRLHFGLQVQVGHEVHAVGRKLDEDLQDVKAEMHLLKGSRARPMSDSQANTRRSRRKRNLDQLEIPEDHVTITDELLGKGGFGEVFLADYNTRNAAAKVLSIAKDLVALGEKDMVDEPMAGQHNPQWEQRKRKAFLRELEAMVRLRSPHTVNVFGVVTTLPGRMVLVMELLAGGDLRTFLKNSRQPLPEKQSRQLIQDVCTGMAFLHSKNTVHGDLKSANVMLDGDGRAKIGDFGTSRWSHHTNSTGLATYTTKSHQNTHLSLAWSAPEVLESGGSTYASDVYSFGIVVWEVLSRDLPWADKTRPRDILSAVLQGARPIFHDDAPADIVSIARACWDGEPEARTTFSAIMQGMRKGGQST